MAEIEDRRVPRGFQAIAKQPVTFATTAERDVVWPSSVVQDGWWCYITATDELLLRANGAWVTVWTSASGVLAPTGAWTDYTPTLTQSATVTKTVSYARYRKVGRKVDVAMLLSVTGTGTAGQEIVVGLPPFTPVQTNNQSAGVGDVFDSSAVLDYFAVVAIGSSTFKLFPTSVNGVTALGGAAFTAALANGDAIRATFSYESTT